MEYKTILHRFEYATVRKLKDQSKIEKAMKTQDKIRNQATGGADLTTVIRKWRDKDASGT